MVTVRVPATTANLGPGFDTLGLALALYNTLTFEELAEGLYFEGVDPEYATAENLAVVAYKAVLSKLGLPMPGLRISVQAEIPICRGLGSSAALIAAGAAGANANHGSPLTRAELLAVCEGMHYALVALHIRIQTAAAYAMLDKGTEAKPLLAQALQAAGADGFFLPFVENYRYLHDLLSTLPQTEQVTQITALGEAYETRCAQLRAQGARPAALGELTRREMEITQLMAQHLTNKEIAQQLFLSEGTVKQYMNQIYSKLQITGDTRTKRRRLLDLVEQKP